MLYGCYDLIPVHTVMEISWRYSLTDYAMVGYTRERLANRC